MNIDKTSLYMQDASGGIRVWTIWAEDFEIYISHGTLGGEEQIQTEYIEWGLASRSREEQVQSRINSRINKKKDKGYSESIEKARSGRPSNLMGFPKPMLAAKYENVKYVDFSKTFVQYKYDGHRCLIANDNGQLIAYSRNGKPIESIEHILAHMVIPEGAVIDGELYIHGSRLQKIGSLVKRKQKESRMLKYHCYDMVSELSFAQRYDLLKTYHLGGNALLAPTWSAARDFDVENDLIIAKESGYEGLMLRVDGTGYEDGRRSKSLLKVKSVQDDEYTVVQITSSKDNWAILHCELPDGGRFSVTAPGAVFEKEYVLKNARAFIGKQVTVEYAMLTEDGKPFHPVATQWRNKNDE